MPGIGHSRNSVDAPTVPAGGLIGALDRLRMRIPRSARAARSRRRVQYAGAWVLVSPTK